MSDHEGQQYVPPQQFAQQQPVVPGGPESSPKGMGGMLNDAATLVAAGLLFANALAILAGVINFMGDPGALGDGFRSRLSALTVTVDVGDIALLGIAAAMLVLTADPVGGIPRKILLLVNSGLAAIITVFGVIRALLVISQDGDFFYRFAGFIATVGLVVAAATIAFFSFKEASTRTMKTSS